MAEKKATVINSFTQICEGADGSLKGSGRVHASITTYNNGNREVGCGFMNRRNGACRVGELPCVHLFPLNQSLLSKAPVGLSKVVEDLPQESRRFTTVGTTVEGKNFGVWEDEEGREQVDYYEGTLKHTVYFEILEPIGPDHPYWTKLHSAENN